MNLKEIAEQGREIEKRLGFDLNDTLNKLTQEVGEVNDAVQKYRGIYCRKKGSIKHVQEELGDVMYNLSSICLQLGLNPNELITYAENTLEKFKIREKEYLKK